MESFADRVGAVVVNYNAGEALCDAVSSLRAVGIRDVVVVDNDSRDDSIAALEARDAEVHVLHSANVGFGAGVNKGAIVLEVLHPKIEYMFVLNPDAQIRPESLDILIHAMDDDTTLGVVGPRIVGTDGTLYPSARRFPNLMAAMGHALLGSLWPKNPWTRQYKRLDENYDAFAHVDWVSGSAMFMRKRMFDFLGGFDESYFMYFEDVDICWRMHRNGFGVAFVPDAQVMHIGGVSTATAPRRMLRAHHRSAARFAARTLVGAQRVLLPIVWIGLGARLVAMSATSASSRWKSGSSRLKPQG